MKWKNVATASLTLSLFCGLHAPGAIIYVDGSAVGNGDGTSWANARTDLAEAVAAAQVGDEIWVATGDYFGPIALKNGVKIIGGFAGTETLASQSNPFLNRTYINGTNDTRAVTGTDNDSSAILRGFYITGGGLALPEFGAGMELKNSSAAIVDCVFTENGVEMSLGGAVTIWGGSPAFINCAFLNNQALGGAAVMIRDEATPTFVNGLFAQNIAEEAGAVSVVTGSPSFTNCTFADNSATVGEGGALFDYGGNATLRNCILWNNFSARDSHEIFNHPTLGGPSTVSYSNVKGGYPGVGNIGEDEVAHDPKFAAAAEGNYRLLSDSPCKDAGDSTVLPADTYDADWDGDTTEKTPDLAKAPRVVGAEVDMGAYENSCFAPTPPTSDPGLVDGGFGTANRYISFVPQNPGQVTAIRVTLAELPSPFGSFEGTTMWVAAPQDTSEVAHKSDSTSPTFKASRLSCDPVYLDWASLGTIYVYDDEIVPNATYQIQAIYEACDVETEEFYSAGLVVRTSAFWGDITGDCSATPCTPPDGIVDTVDVDAVEQKMQGIPGAVIKARSDVDPDVPDRLVSTSDLVKVIDASNGISYPYDGPTECQSGGGGLPGGGDPPGGE